MRMGKKIGKKIIIGITALLFVFIVGWVIYSQVYHHIAIKDTKLTAEAKTEKEKSEDSNSETVQEEEKTSVKTKKLKKLAAPKKLQALYSKEGALVSWKKVKGADSYLVYRREKDGKLKQIAETEKTSYTDETVKKNTAYRYRICAVMKSGEESLNGKMTTGTAYYHSKIDPDKPMVALTFDDGPSIYTPEILKQLKKYNARATFFVVGERVNSYANTIKQASKQGCEIGSHSYSHANLGTASAATIDSQLNKTEKRIKKILGYYTPIMRPPYGSISTKLRKKVGKPMILWSIDTLDWKTRNTASTVKAVMSKVEDGDIVLMHDLYSATKDAALKIIPKLIKKGYQLVTVSEMATYKGYALENGKAYTDIK